MNMTTVYNIDTDFKLVYSLPPEQAVIFAHAQTAGDNNTWDTLEKYSHLLKETKFGYVCGKFWAQKQKQQ